MEPVVFIDLESRLVQLYNLYSSEAALLAKSGCARSEAPTDLNVCKPPPVTSSLKKDNVMSPDMLARQYDAVQSAIADQLAGRESPSYNEWLSARESAHQAATLAQKLRDEQADFAAASAELLELQQTAMAAATAAASKALLIWHLLRKSSLSSKLPQLHQQ